MQRDNSGYQKITTGSSKFDDLLGGGLPTSCITDVFGSAGTGKTQFALQNIVTTCAETIDAKPCSVFVDCSGSFRPERIAEIAKARDLEPDGILDRIYTIYVRSVYEQMSAIQRVAKEDIFSRCRLVVIDDATSNYVIEFGSDQIPARQSALLLHIRYLAVLANSRRASVVTTNSVRSRGELGEGETTGEIFSQFALYRLHFEQRDNRRVATLLQPRSNYCTISFEISESGIS